MKNDNKPAFVAELGRNLREHTREEIFGLDYDEDSDGFEAVTILYTNGCTRTVNVTGDSCIAIMQDVARALM
ncbi:MAG: hypothetical protein IJ723_00120 [Ruminococcus sp.]|nr:hypothetical protein [Ruminococcus sp.]